MGTCLLLKFSGVVSLCLGGGSALRPPDQDTIGEGAALFTSAHSRQVFSDSPSLSRFGKRPQNASECLQSACSLLPALPTGVGGGGSRLQLLLSSRAGMAHLSSSPPLPLSHGGAHGMTSSFLLLTHCVHEGSWRGQRAQSQRVGGGTLPSLTAPRPHYCILPRPSLQGLLTLLHISVPLLTAPREKLAGPSQRGQICDGALLPWRHLHSSPGSYACDYNAV